MQFASINGVTLHYQVIAAPDDKPTLVFSNSLGTDFRIWRDCIVRLAGQFSIVLYDKRGHGLSDVGTTPYKIDDHVADLAGLLDHLGVDNAVVCGLSVGGVIAQGLLYTRPDLVRALILCDTAAKIGDEAMWNDRIKSIGANGLDGFADSILERWFTKHFRTNNANDFAGYRNMLTRTPVEGYLGTCAALRDADLREAAKIITVPTICIVGEEDGATPPELVLETARMIPNARFEKISKAGHIPCVEQPEILVEIFRAFMKDADII
ncbi:MAG: 3-oxoadipate enol-lactonase [Hyphomicrobiales bacterium]|nr:MAG: 3-oxoadipate enol-lactonase [Hyphomicrobiales bacterium]